MKRSLKVYYKYRRLGVFDPMIRLQGKWLAEAGIRPGDRINIDVQRGQITITKEKQL
jgi:hypothetical protein